MSAGETVTVAGVTYERSGPIGHRWVEVGIPSGLDAISRIHAILDALHAADRARDDLAEEHAEDIDALLNRLDSAESERDDLRRQLGDAERERDQLCGAVATAAQVFDAYAALHARKGTPHADLKAMENREWADRMRAALDAAHPAPAAPAGEQTRAYFNRPGFRE